MTSETIEERADQIKTFTFLWSVLSKKAAGPASLPSGGKNAGGFFKVELLPDGDGEGRRLRCFRISKKYSRPQSLLLEPPAVKRARRLSSVFEYFFFLKTRGREGTSDFRLRTSDFRLQTSDFRLRTSDFRLQTSDFRLQTSDFRLQISDFRLLTLELSFYPLAVYVIHQL